MKTIGTLAILIGAAIILELGIFEGLIRVLALPTRLIRRIGRPAVGTVISTRLRTVQAPGMIGPVTNPLYTHSTVYHTEGLISFTTAEGRVVEFWTDLEGRDAPEPHGGAYELRYLPEFPRIHRFTTPGHRSSWNMMISGLIFGGAVLWLGIWLYHKGR
jgi:hypothetical protein